MADICLHLCFCNMVYMGREHNACVVIWCCRHKRRLNGHKTTPSKRRNTQHSTKHRHIVHGKSVLKGARFGLIWFLRGRLTGAVAAQVDE